MLGDQLAIDIPKVCSSLPYETDQDTVPCDESWAVTAEVYIRGNDASAIATHNLHRNTSSAFKAAANVSAVPS